MPSLPAYLTRRCLRLPRALSLAAFLCVAGWPGGPPRLGAQTTGFRLLIVDDETGDPIAAASVRVKGATTDALTGDNGQVTLDGLQAGKVEVEIRAIGYEPRKETLVVQAGRLLERRLGLQFTGDKMPDVVVTARREKLVGRYQDFHRRMVSGSGVFITWEEIKQRSYSRLGDALRNIRGVQVNCRTHDCAIFMSRSSSCPPTIWVDGTESNYFGPNTPIGDVYGIEVYRGAGEIPAEYAGTSMCGAVVIWTKNRPYR